MSKNSSQTRKFAKILILIPLILAFESGGTLVFSFSQLKDFIFQMIFPHTSTCIPQPQISSPTYYSSLHARFVQIPTTGI